jgi:signal transduction histidine kinase
MSRKILIWTLASIAVTGLVAGGVFYGDFAWSLGWVAYALVGALILLKRPENAIGWLLLAIGMTWPIAFFCLFAVERSASPSVWLEMLASSVGYTGWLLMIMVPVLFPTGSPSDRWTRFLRTALFVVLGLVIVSEFLSSQPKETSGLVSPLAVPWLAGFTRFMIEDGFVMVPLLLFVSLGSLIVRWRRSSGTERLQYRWLLVAIGITVAGLLLSEALPEDQWFPAEILFPLVLSSIPAAIGFAVFRYRLYDIDLVINRTVLFGLLAAFITAVYSVIVVGLSALGTQGELVPSIVATAVIALAFEPVRLRAQRWADRVAYGKRASPYEVLSDLTRRLASTESAQGLLDRIARRLADGTGAERAGVWVWTDGRLVRAGQWPGGQEAASVSRIEKLPGAVVEIAAHGEQLGALTIEKRRGEAVTPTETRLIHDLAGSSAPVLQNLSLQADLEASAEELEASRRRLYDVQVLERRRLERDLDEGAQQLVVSLKVKLNVAFRLARMEGVERLAAMLEGMDHDARAAITQIRSLARGLYPPLLEEEGVVAAVRSLSDDAAVSVEVDAAEVGRLPAELEAAVFFCISEAITNAAKHAPGAVVTVRIEQLDGHLEFSVQDRGPGFDLATIKAGSGLRNMADRLDAVGGLLEINSTPGRGTVISGRVPLRDRSLVEIG